MIALARPIAVATAAAVVDGYVRDRSATQPNRVVPMPTFESSEASKDRGAGG